MATGASTADLAVILVDARKGVLPQTRRHTRIVALIGIRHVLLAVNKMDLVGYRAGRVRRHRRRVRHVRRTRSESTNVTAIPISALEGDNVVGASSRRCPGTRADRARAPRDGRCRRPRRAGRSACRCSGSTGRTGIFAALPARRARHGAAGRSRSRAAVRRADARSTPSSRCDGDLDAGGAGRRRHADADRRSGRQPRRRARRAAAPPAVADQFEATLVWMGEHDLLPGRAYC